VHPKPSSRQQTADSRTGEGEPEGRRPLLRAEDAQPYLIRLHDHGGPPPPRQPNANGHGGERRRPP